MFYSVKLQRWRSRKHDAAAITDHSDADHTDDPVPDDPNDADDSNDAHDAGYHRNAYVWIESS